MPEQATYVYEGQTQCLQLSLSGYFEAQTAWSSPSRTDFSLWDGESCAYVSQDTTLISQGTLLTLSTYFHFYIINLML